MAQRRRPTAVHHRAGHVPVLRWTRTNACWRTHDERDPWYFSSSPGRFNLVAPRGTLNTASDEHTAAREYLGHVLIGQQDIPAALVEGRRVSKLRLPPRRLADVTSSSATPFGVVAGDFSGPSPTGYTAHRLWAEALDDAGFEGIHNRSRFGTGASPACFYFFGPAGVHVIGSVDREVPLEDVLTQQGTYRIVPPKDSGTLSFEP